MRVPAVVGSWPEPFVHGSEGKAFPVRIDCLGEDDDCSAVADRLEEEGSRRASQPSGRSSARSVLRVVVGPWEAVRQDRAAVQIEDGPAQSGVYADFEPARRRLRPGPDPADREAFRARPAKARGFVAAVRLGEEQPTWVVTGTDEAGVDAAIELLDADSLRDHYAVGVDERDEFALPVTGEGAGLRPRCARRSPTRPAAAGSRRLGPRGRGVPRVARARGVRVLEPDRARRRRRRGRRGRDRRRRRAALAASVRWGSGSAQRSSPSTPSSPTAGDTVLVRGYDVPVLGPMDVTLESLAAGAVLAERILVVTIAFAVWSACVDPDRVLRVVRPLARRSALTATLCPRLVPIAAGDLARLREAAALRGPAPRRPAGRPSPAGSWPARSIAQWTSRRRSSSAATRSGRAPAAIPGGARATTGGSSPRASRSPLRRRRAARRRRWVRPVSGRWRWTLTQRRSALRRPAVDRDPSVRGRLTGSTAACSRSRS